MEVLFYGQLIFKFCKTVLKWIKKYKLLRTELKKRLKEFGSRITCHWRHPTDDLLELKKIILSLRNMLPFRKLKKFLFLSDYLNKPQQSLNLYDRLDLKDDNAANLPNMVGCELVQLWIPKILLQ